MAQSFITFFLDNNVAIIQIGFAIIFVLVVFVILRSFKEDKEASTPAARSISERRKELESTEEKVTAPPPEKEEPEEETNPLDDLDSLDDLMGATPEISQEEIDQTLSEVTDEAPSDSVPPPPDFEAAAAGAQSAASEVQARQNDELAKALKEKEKVIADLRVEIETLQKKDNGNVGDAEALKEKVAELSDKLAEYEIIEDDIANLSFYKSENIKLKNELEKLRGANASLAEAESEAENASSAKAEAAQTEEQDVLAEFQEAVKQKEALEQNVIETEEVKKPTAMDAPTDADLLNEFESAVEAEIADKPQDGKGENKDENKDEKKEEPKVDSEKLVEEAEQLAATEAPKVESDGKDNSEKLIEEFENFLNKT